MNADKNRTANKVSVMIVMLMLYSASTLAFPVPHGIDGVIYDLDGITEVPAGISFTINDTTSGEFIQGKTGHGSSGGHSASMNGNDGDIIIVRAWNKYNQANITITLTGVMHNLNLLLNMTYPAFAPNITTLPILNAVQDEAYAYDVDAFDENMDVLNYSLVNHPSGMSINSVSGLITWTPTNAQVGANQASVEATDGIFAAAQNFTVMVENVNDAPVINSTPLLNARVGEFYFYDVNATDPDGDALNYSLPIKPRGMSINQTTGLIKWRPDKKQIGNNTVEVQVRDNNLTATQIFSVYVKFRRIYAILEEDEETNGYNVEAESGGNSEDNYGGGSGGIGERLVFAGKSNTSLPMNVSSLEMITVSTWNTSDTLIIIKKMNGRPDTIRTLPKRVYQYLEINKTSSRELEYAVIKFRIEKQWLNKNRLNKSDIALSRFTGKSWADLPTNIIGEDEAYEYYEAKTNGFSYFAITVKEEAAAKAAAIAEPLISKINAPFRISGVIYDGSERKQAEYGTELIITNLNTGRALSSKTGIGKSSGGYSILVNGDYGDAAEISATGINQPFRTTLADMDNLNLMINRRNNELTKITGFAELGRNSNTLSETNQFLMIIAIMALTFILTNKFIYMD